MSEHNWTYGNKKNNRSHHNRSNPSNFPRKNINEFEGTRLGMRRRVGYTEWRKSKWILNDSCIYGLINKYIGKPYEDFHKEWHKRIVHLKDSVTDSYLDWYFGKGYWAGARYAHNPYSIDKNGLIQKNVYKRHHKKGLLTSQQYYYNRHKCLLPNLGCVVDLHNPTYPLLAKYGSPIRIGKAYVEVDGEVRLETIYNYTAADSIKSSNNSKELRELSNNWQKVTVKGLKPTPRLYASVPSTEYQRVFNILKHSEELSEEDLKYYTKRLEYLSPTKYIEVSMNSYWSFWIRK